MACLNWLTYRAPLWNCAEYTLHEMRRAARQQAWLQKVLPRLRRDAGTQGNARIPEPARFPLAVDVASDIGTSDAHCLFWRAASVVARPGLMKGVPKG